MDLGTYTEASLELLPAASRRLRLTAIEEVDKNPKYVEEGDDPRQWKWDWTVEGGDADGKTVFVWSNKTIGKKSKAYPWVLALLGRKPNEGERITTGMLLGKSLDCYLSDKREQGSPGYRIIDPLPVRDASKPVEQRKNSEQLQNDYNAAVAVLKGLEKPWTDAKIEAFKSHTLGREETRPFPMLPPEDQATVEAAITTKASELIEF